MLAVRMLGSFEAAIDGRRVEWIRRREAQIFKYLLLKDDGAASRDELRDVFWPGVPVQLGTQSLRTASSNIRKALAALVGYPNVERYFSSRGDISINLDNVTVDVRRLRAHVADGDAERERGHARQALAHYRAAESIYRGELLLGEYPERWYAPHAAAYQALFVYVLERIGELLDAAGRPNDARQYAERARGLSGDGTPAQP
jgi:DNA-binding SARP family transcriptional activator